MLYKLDPLDVTLDFEWKPYRLGDMINATVTLTPNSDVKIRRADLSLVARVRRTKVGKGRTMGVTIGFEDGASTIDAGRIGVTTDYLPMQQTTEQKIYEESLYGTQFLTSASLQKDLVSRHKVDLKIGPQLPKLAQKAKELQWDANNAISFEQWWLEVQVDVVRGRNPSVRQRIDVTLSKAARSARTASLKPLRISE